MAEESPASKAFAARLAKFAYPDQSASPRLKRGAVREEGQASSSQSPSSSRRTTRKVDQGRHDTEILVKEEEGDHDEKSERAPSSGEARASTPLKSRKRVSTGDSASLKKVKKVPRPYAGPEVYAHLKNTPDHLAPNLDIIFCGIKQEVRSYRNTLRTPNQQVLGICFQPHFKASAHAAQRALHQSGLTTRLYAPSECHLLPAEFNYGLTNLCGRPTAEQSELSTLEMRLNVHPFTLKLLRLRPRVVCFVGKKIWDVFEAVAGKTARLAPVSEMHGPSGSHLGDVKPDIPGSPLDGGEVKLDIPSTPSTPTSKTGKSITPRSRKGKASSEPFDWFAPRSLRLPLPPVGSETEWGYCYFWVTPSTSGLERTPLAEQVSIFAALRAFVELLGHDGQGTDLPLQPWQDIDIEGLAETAEKMRADAIAKGTTVYPSVHESDEI